MTIVDDLEMYQGKKNSILKSQLSPKDGWFYEKRDLSS